MGPEVALTLMASEEVEAVDGLRQKL
jgi:hypothetical protein